MSGTAPSGAVAARALREAENWASAQCELVSGIGSIWTDWLRRQQEAIDASAHSLQRMCESRNLAEFAQTQQQWLADTLRRSTSDFSTLASESMALTWRVVGVDRLGWRDASPAPRGPSRAKSAEEAPLHRAAAE